MRYAAPSAQVAASRWQLRPGQTYLGQRGPSADHPWPEAKQPPPGFEHVLDTVELKGALHRAALPWRPPCARGSCRRACAGLEAPRSIDLLAAQGKSTHIPLCAPALGRLLVPSAGTHTGVQGHLTRCPSRGCAPCAVAAVSQRGAALGPWPWCLPQQEHGPLPHLALSREGQCRDRESARRLRVTRLDCQAGAPRDRARGQGPGLGQGQQREANGGGVAQCSLQLVYRSRIREAQTNRSRRLGR